MLSKNGTFSCPQFGSQAEERSTIQVVATLKRRFLALNACAALAEPAAGAERVASPPPPTAAAALAQPSARPPVRSTSSKSLPARVASPAPVSSPTKPAPSQELFDLLSLDDPPAAAQPAAAAARAASSNGADAGSDWAAWGDAGSTVSGVSAEAAESDPWDAFQGSEGFQVGSPASLPAGCEMFILASLCDDIAAVDKTCRACLMSPPAC